MKKIIIVFIVLIFAISYSNSQGIPCDSNYQGLSFSFPKLLYVPPLSLDMPLDVILGYIAADSVRHYSNYSQLKEFLDRQTMNDTMMYIIKHYYQMVDYDPIRFYLYRDFGDSCTCTISLMKNQLFNKLFSLITNPIGDIYLICSDIIAHVRVVDTVATVDTSSCIYPRGAIVTCEVLDTIKGKVLPPCDYYNNNLIMKKDMPVPGGCLQFDYAYDWPRGPIEPIDVVLIGSDGYPWTGIKSKLIDSTGVPWIVTGREYIVFLKFFWICMTDDLYFYGLLPFCEGSMTYGIYPIISGIVYDPSNEFGFGNNLSVVEFKSRLRDRISFYTSFGE